MEEWGVGRMEYWRIGIIDIYDMIRIMVLKETFRHDNINPTIIPLFHYSTIPSFQIIKL